MIEKTVTVKQKYVEDCIRDAVRTLQRLPEERVQAPNILRTFFMKNDIYARFSWTAHVFHGILLI